MAAERGLSPVFNDQAFRASGYAPEKLQANGVDRILNQAHRTPEEAALHRLDDWLLKLFPQGELGSPAAANMEAISNILRNPQFAHIGRNFASRLGIRVEDDEKPLVSIIADSGESPSTRNTRAFYFSISNIKSLGRDNSRIIYFDHPWQETIGPATKQMFQREEPYVYYYDDKPGNFPRTMFPIRGANPRQRAWAIEWLYCELQAVMKQAEVTVQEDKIRLALEQTISQMAEKEIWDRDDYNSIMSANREVRESFDAWLRAEENKTLVHAVEDERLENIPVDKKELTRARTIDGLVGTVVGSQNLHGSKYFEFLRKVISKTKGILFGLIISSSPFNFDIHPDLPDTLYFVDNYLTDKVRLVFMQQYFKAYCASKIGRGDVSYTGETDKIQWKIVHYLQAKYTGFESLTEILRLGGVTEQ